MNDMTVMQVQKIISDFHGGATGWQIKPNTLDVDEHGNAEFEVFEEKTLFRKLLGFVILDREGEQVATVTPVERGRIYEARRFFGDEHDDKTFDDGWDAPYISAQNYARNHAADRVAS